MIDTCIDILTYITLRKTNTYNIKNHLWLHDLAYKNLKNHECIFLVYLIDNKKKLVETES